SVHVLRLTEATLPPSFTKCPIDQNLGCNPASIPSLHHALAISTDDCGTPKITCASFNGPVVSCVHYRTNVYTATDACQHSATCVQVLSSTEDTLPPSFTKCPSDQNLGCNPASIPDCNPADAEAT